MAVSRRAYLTASGAFASVGILRFPAGAAEFTYKLAHDQPTTHPMAIRAAEAADKVMKDTNGRVEIKTFPNSILGGDTQMLTQMRAGAIELLLMGNSVMPNVVPVTALAGTPFAFANYAELWKAMDGDFGNYLRVQIKKANIFAFDKAWDSGFRQVVNSARPINTADDMKGLKLRVPEAPILVSLFKALGASPTPMNFNEVYTAMQTHLVDGCELPWANIVTGKYYEVGKYVSVTNHVATTFDMLANADAWNKLPKQLQDVLERDFDAAALLERQDLAKGVDTYQAQLKSAGAGLNNANVATFRSVVGKAGLYAEWRTQYGGDAFALLEKAVGKLA